MKRSFAMTSGQGRHYFGVEPYVHIQRIMPEQRKRQPLAIMIIS